MAHGKQLVSSSDSSEFNEEGSEETHDSSQCAKQKPAKENSPLLNPENDSDEEDSGSKDAGKGKQKLEGKGSPEDATGSKDAPKAEKQRSGPVNPHGKDSATDESAATIPNATKVTNKSSGRKRPRESEANHPRESESNQEANQEGLNMAKQPSQRVWTNGDEILLLKGLIEKGADVWSNMDAFRSYINKSASFICTESQLKDKIRRLKKKYLKKVHKGDNTFPSAHERRLFRLCNKLWDKQKKVEKATEVGVGVNVNIPVNKALGVPSLEEEILSTGLALVEGPEKEALEKRWKRVRIAELEAYLERTKILVDQAKLVLDHYKA